MYKLNDVICFISDKRYHYQIKSVEPKIKIVCIKSPFKYGLNHEYTSNFGDWSSWEGTKLVRTRPGNHPLTSMFANVL